MEIGIYTFADVGFGEPGVSAAQRIPEIIEEVVLADQVGLSVFGLGNIIALSSARPRPR